MTSSTDPIMDEVIARLVRVEEKVKRINEDEGSSPANLATWLPEAFHVPGVIGGIVVDEGKAREGDCHCIPLGDSSQLCYSGGVVGALSRDQEQLYCTTFQTKEVSEALQRRTRILRDATIICQGQVQNLKPEERLEPFMQCLVKEAKAKGLEI